MSIIEQKLNQIQNLVNDGMSAKNTAVALSVIGLDGYDENLVKEFRLWNDYMPLMDEDPYTEEQRNLHILWECIDRVPLGINCAFSIPFRQILAQKLFKKCGVGFVANEGCRFNFANRIEIGDNVSWNAGCYIDAKGGVKFGDFAMLTEYVKVFTHSHSESNHMQRTYAPVEIGKYAKVYTNATILPGVKLGVASIVATGAIVTKDVDAFTLVSGIPARPQRLRNFDFDGANFDEMKQYMMKDKLFQNDGAI